MNRILRGMALVLGVVAVLALAGYAWASISASRALAQTFVSHEVDIPVPYPLPQAEVERLGLTPEAADSLAGQRAIERGRHLIAARYACTECHGENFAGGTMIDAFPIGSIYGPNLTGGEGSRVGSFTTADWDRIVRHGILPGGLPAAMPAEDFRLMSDQELSDVIHYIRSVPPVDNATPQRSLGPLGKVLLATGQLPLSASLIGQHDAPHKPVPPPEGATVVFGEHLAATCTGCHGMDFRGGPIPGGDPSWAPARNLTAHETGLASWDLDDFKRAMREGVRPDGTPLVAPMTLALPYTSRMSDVEIEALWNYLRTVPPQPTGT